MAVSKGRAERCLDPSVSDLAECDIRLAGHIGWRSVYPHCDIVDRTHSTLAKTSKAIQERILAGPGYNIFSFALFSIVGGNAAYALIVIPFNDFLANVFNAEYPLVYVIDEVPMWVRIVMLLLSSELASY